MISYRDNNVERITGWGVPRGGGGTPWVWGGPTLHYKFRILCENPERSLVCCCRHHQFAQNQGFESPVESQDFVEKWEHAPEKLTDFC